MDSVHIAGGRADLAQQIVCIGDARVRLTTKERDVLAYLAQNPGRTVTRSELLVQVWKNPASGSEEPVYSVVKRLRAKIDRGPHRHIVGVHGDGYRWSPAPPDAGETPTATPDQADAPERRPPATRFFGREAELAAIRGAFASGRRLVTLVGPGGAGKTRSAREVAEGREHVFADISSASTEGAAIAAIAAALGVPLDGVEPSEWARGVGRALRAEPERLVVLDNAEHLIEAVAGHAATWLDGGPPLLVTSREPLRLAGEQVVPIGPLPLATAVELFVDRSSAAGAGALDAPLVTAIAERVDRLPLSLELAAALTPQLGAKALLESLDAQLDALVAGPRDAPTRHATLRAAVEWSWTFLGEREREVLGVLAVFEGSFDASAARAVVGTPDTLAVVASLCRRCQARFDNDRFVLYAAVRELARGQAADLASAEKRHAAHYVTAGEAAADLLDGHDHRRGAAALAADLSELRAAWERSLDRDPVTAARLALVIDRAWGLSAERSGARRALLSKSRAQLEDPALRCALYLAEGNVAGAPASLFDDALELAADPRAEAQARLARGERLAATGLQAARSELERARDLAREAGSERLRGRVLAALGEVFWRHGLVREATEHLRGALALHEHTGDRRAIARSSALLAHLDRIEGGGRAARALLEKAENAAAELDDPVVRARVLLDLGQHLTRTGDQAAGREALTEAAEIFERVGFLRERALLHLHVAETLVGIADFDAALGEALAALSALPDAQDVSRSTVHEAIGCIHLLRSDLGEADRWFERGLAIARDVGAIRSECTLLGKRGLLHLARGDAKSAFYDFDTAVKKNEERGSSQITGASLADRALAAFAAGRIEEAARDLARARQLLEEPSEDSTAGRMLVGCEVVGRALASILAGAPAAEAHDKARTQMTRLLERIPANEWNVVLRLLDWLVTCVRTT
ncbi:MAG: AAA family ATPase [Polyangiaceae bacterium]|nr:AAA family ATPase [Polyangiaceae bacterium]